MNTKFRIQDIVAKTSGVSLKSTVNVLQSLYLVSKSLGYGESKEMKAFSQTLKLWLMNAQLNEEGEFCSLKSFPLESHKLACSNAYVALEHLLGREVLSKVKNKQFDLFEMEL